VAPWEVNEISGDWLEALLAMDELPKMQKSVEGQKKHEASWLQRNGYRAYLKGRK
jgi:hypothetical protein